MYHLEGLTQSDTLAGSAPVLGHPWLARQTVLKWCLARTFLVEVLQCHGSTLNPLGHVLQDKTKQDFTARSWERGLTPTSKTYVTKRIVEL